MSEPVRRYYIIDNVYLLVEAVFEEAPAEGYTAVVTATDYDALAAQVEALKAKLNEMADQASTDTQRFIDCTNAIKRLVPDATSLENGIQRVEAAWREARGLLDDLVIPRKVMSEVIEEARAYLNRTKGNTP